METSTQYWDGSAWKGIPQLRMEHVVESTGIQGCGDTLKRDENLERRAIFKSELELLKKTIPEKRRLIHRVED